MVRFLLIIITLTPLLSQAQNEFDKYGPFGSPVYTDFKLALDVGSTVYKVDLSYQKIEPKLYAKFNKLKDLQALKLSGNDITTYPPNFSDLINLVYFASYNNAFESFIPSIKNFYALNYLEFFGAKFDSIPTEIAYLNKLKTFKISSTNDTLKLPESLHYMKALKDLTIENCLLDSISEEIFKIPNLTFLNLTNTNTFYIPTTFSKMPNLEVLILDANHLEKIPFQIYLSKKIRFLSVKNNHLKKLPDSISQLENLTVLDVTGNSFPKAYIEELKALLPGCEIRY